MLSTIPVPNATEASTLSSIILLAPIAEDALEKTWFSCPIAIDPNFVIPCTPTSLLLPRAKLA